MKLKAAVIAFFAIITLFQLWPLSTRPWDSVYDTKDSLLNTWIISWVQTRIFPHPLSLFDANIYYPFRNTLSYSEHMFPQAVFSIPARWLSGNPVFVYNFILLFSYFLNALAMFLFVRYLTGNDFAGISCGLMFAFNSHLLSHVAHVQLLSSGLIPLSFLYLHRFLEERRPKDAVLFSFFFALQGLASLYYGLFFLTILVLIIPLGFLIFRKPLDSSLLVKFFLPLSVSGAVLFVFSLPYLSFMKTFRLDRGAQKGADIINYLAVSPGNKWLGTLLSRFGKNEHWLFPGIAAVVLAGYALARKKALFHAPPRIFRFVIIGLILAGSATLAVTLITGGASWKWGFLSVSLHHLAKQALFIVIPGIIYALVSLLVFLLKGRRGISFEEKSLILYLFLLFWSLLLSLGNYFSFAGDSTAVFPLPFGFFSAALPGFKGIRVPARYAIFVIFCVAVLAGYGLKYLSAVIKKRRARVLLGLSLILFLNLEYRSIPFQKTTVPVKKSIPPVYSWLREGQGRFAVLELPFFPQVSDEAIYMYFSLSHRKDLVNGYSGFLPLSHEYLIPRIFKNFPTRPCLDILRALKVKYVVLHMKMWERRQRVGVVRRINKHFHGDLRLAKRFRYASPARNDLAELFSDDRVFEVIPKPEEKIGREELIFSEISASDWEVEASHNPEKLFLLKDNKIETRWTAASPKANGQFLVVKFRQPRAVSRVSLGLGKFYDGFAKDLSVETSEDGITWKKAAGAYSLAEFALDLIRNPSRATQDLDLPGDRIKCLRITQMGRDENVPWAVAEMTIFR